MSERGRIYGQQDQMEDASMVGTLRTQAEMIWPQERILLEAAGFGEMQRVADLGCGTGEFAGRVAEAWASLQVCGLDIFSGHLELARRRFPADHHPRLEFLEGDARRTPWDTASFDAVTIRHVLHALPDAEVVLAEAARLLRRGGVLHVLAEDYAGLIFDTDDAGAQRLFIDAQAALLQHGTELFHGRQVYRALRAAGYTDVRVETLVVDTSNTSRKTFASMMGFWRDGYADFIAESSDTAPALIRARFDALIEVLKDPDRYAAWYLPVVTGRR